MSGEALQPLQTWKQVLMCMKDFQYLYNIKPLTWAHIVAVLLKAENILYSDKYHTYNKCFICKLHTWYTGTYVKSDFSCRCSTFGHLPRP